MARQASRLNSLTEIALTKLDVLDTLDEIKVCVAYEANGVRYDYPPYHQSVLHEVTPIYEVLPGWNSDITAFDDVRRSCPRRPRVTCKFLEETTGVTISVVGVGPGREQFVRPS